MDDYTELQRVAENHRIRVLDLEISDQILTLIAENNLLREDRYQFKAELADLAHLKAYVTVPMRERCAERDQLKAEVERLRKALTDIRENSDNLTACERAADALKDVSRCQCGGQDGRYHSDLCIVETAKSQGWSNDPEAKECQARIDRLE